MSALTAVGAHPWDEVNAAQVDPARIANWFIVSPNCYGVEYTTMTHSSAIQCHLDSYCISSDEAREIYVMEGTNL